MQGSQELVREVENHSEGAKSKGPSEWCLVPCNLYHVVQWTLDYPDLDYPDPRLSGSRTEIIARAYNDLRMRVVAVDKKNYCIHGC